MATPQPKKKLNNWLLVIISLVIIGLVWVGLKLQSNCRSVNITLPDNYVISATIAATPWQRTIGLSGRESLATDRGMLFLFNEPGIYPFWMKNTNIPLDIIWVKDKIIVDVASLPAETTNETTPFHTPQVAADSVLEINVNQAKHHGVSIGQRLTWNTTCKAL